MAINVDILKIAPSSLVDTDMWNALLLAVQQQLMMVGKKAGLKDALYKFDPTTLPYSPTDPMYTTYPTTTSYSQDMQYWIDYIVSFCKSFGYDPNLEMVTDLWTKEQIVKLLYQEAQSIWYKATHKGTKNFYDYVFKLYALLGGVYTILRSEDSFYRYLQWSDVTRYVDSNSDSLETYVEEGILSKIRNYTYGTPFTGIVPEKDASSIFTRSLTFDSEWEFDADVEWYFDQYTDILPTTHMAFDYICDRVWTEVDDTGLTTKMLTPKRILSYLRKAIDYGRKCTVVPHIGAQLNIVTPENLFFDAYSSGNSIPALELDTSITRNFSDTPPSSSLNYTDNKSGLDDYMDLSGDLVERTDGDFQTDTVVKSSDRIYQYLSIGTGKKNLYSIRYPDILTGHLFNIPTDRITPYNLADTTNTVTVHGDPTLLYSKVVDNYDLRGWAGRALYFNSGDYLETESITRADTSLTLYGWFDGAWAVQAANANIFSWAGISVDVATVGSTHTLTITSDLGTPCEYTFASTERPSGLFLLEIEKNDTEDFSSACSIGSFEIGSLVTADVLGTNTELEATLETAVGVDELSGMSMSYIDKFYGEQFCDITHNTAGALSSITFVERKDSFIASGALCSVYSETVIATMEATTIVGSVDTLSVNLSSPVSLNQLALSTLSYEDACFGSKNIKIVSNTSGSNVSVGFASTDNTFIAASTPCTFTLATVTGTLPQQDNIGNVTSFNHITLSGSAAAGSLIGATLNYYDNFEGAKSTTITGNTSSITPTISFASRKDSFIESDTPCTIVFPTVSGTLTPAQENIGNTTGFAATFATSQPANSLIGGVLSFVDAFGNARTVDITGNSAGTTIGITFASSKDAYISGTPKYMEFLGGPEEQYTQTDVKYSEAVTLNQLVGRSVELYTQIGGWRHVVITGNDAQPTPNTAFTIYYENTYFEGGLAGQIVPFSGTACTITFPTLNIFIAEFQGSYGYYTTLPNVAMNINVLANQLAGRTIVEMDIGVGDQSIDILSHGASPYGTFFTPTIASTLFYDEFVSEQDRQLTRANLSGTMAARTPISSLSPRADFRATFAVAQPDNSLIGATVTFTDLLGTSISRIITGNGSLGGTTSYIQFTPAASFILDGTESCTLTFPQIAGEWIDASFDTTVSEITGDLLNWPEAYVDDTMAQRTIRFYDSGDGDNREALIVGNEGLGPGQFGGSLFITPTYINSVADGAAFTVDRANLTGTMVATPTYMVTNHLHASVSPALATDEWKDRWFTYFDAGLNTTKTLKITANTSGTTPQLSFTPTSIGYITAGTSFAQPTVTVSSVAGHMPGITYTTTLNATVSTAVETNELAGRTISYIDAGLGVTKDVVVSSNTSGLSPVLTIPSTSIGYIEANTNLDSPGAIYTGALAEHDASNSRTSLQLKLPRDVSANVLLDSVLTYNDEWSGVQELTISGNTAGSTGSTITINFAPKSVGYISTGGSVINWIFLSGSLSERTPVGYRDHISATLDIALDENQLVGKSLSYIDSQYGLQTLTITGNTAGGKTDVSTISFASNLFGVVQSVNPATCDLLSSEVFVSTAPRVLVVDSLVGGYVKVIDTLYPIIGNTETVANRWSILSVTGTPGISTSCTIYTSAAPYFMRYYWNNTLLREDELVASSISASGIMRINSPSAPFIGFIDEIHGYGKVFDEKTKTYIYENRIGSLYTAANEIYRTAILPSLMREEDDFIHVGVEIPAYSVSNEALSTVGDGTVKVFTHTCVRAPVLPGYTHIYFTATVGGILYNFELKDFGTPGYLYQVAFDDPSNPLPAYLLPIRSEGNINYATGEIVLHTYFTHLVVGQSKALTIDSGDHTLATGTINNLYSPATDYVLFDLNTSPIVVECALESSTVLVTFNTTSYPNCMNVAGIDYATSTFNTSTGVIHIETSGEDIVSANLKQFAGQLWAPPDVGTEVDVQYKTSNTDLQITEAAIVGENDTNTVYAAFPPVMFANINDHMLVNFIVKKESILSLMSEVII